MISPKTIKVNAYRGTSPEKHHVLKGAPLRFIFLLDPSINLTTCSFLRLEIRESINDSNTSLAIQELTDFSSPELEFIFSTAQMNYNITSAWIVLSAFYPEGVGDYDDNIDPLYISELLILP